MAACRTRSSQRISVSESYHQQQATASDMDESSQPLMIAARSSLAELTTQIAEKLEGSPEEQLDLEESVLADREASLQFHWTNAQLRVEQLGSEIADVQLQRVELKQKRADIGQSEHMMPKHEGWFALTDGHSWQCICAMVVAANIVCMVNQDSISAGKTAILNVSFLIFYWAELLLGALHHRHTFFCGSLGRVWWHWLDLGIVISGTVDQLVQCSACSSMRLLRLFRVLRIVKVVKALLRADFHTMLTDLRFEMFMTAVICVNAVTMGMELDVPWFGWIIANNLFLTIYSFDLLVRLRFFGWDFFFKSQDIMWNYLDFTIVSAGMLDLWLLPLVGMVQSEVYGESTTVDLGKFRHVMQVIRLMRLLRVLRLVQVFRRVKPLYKMLRGIKDAVDSMKWVLVVTLITLYAASIVFTHLVGRGLIFADGKAPETAAMNFGTVSSSMFSLFELMNGDVAIADSMVNNQLGKLMFIAFVIVSNWSILAILTSVVSDGMINTTNQMTQEENQTREARVEKEHMDILMGMFVPKDPEKTGHISEQTWIDMLADEHILAELRECSSLSREELIDLFECLAVEEDHLGNSLDTSMVNYHELIKNLQMNTMPADKRSVCHVMMRMQIMQNAICSQIAQQQSVADRRFKDIEERLPPISPELAARLSTPAIRVQL